MRGIEEGERVKTGDHSQSRPRPTSPPHPGEHYTAGSFFLSLNLLPSSLGNPDSVSPCESCVIAEALQARVSHVTREAGLSPDSGWFCTTHTSHTPNSLCSGDRVPFSLSGLVNTSRLYSASGQDIYCCGLAACNAAHFVHTIVTLLHYRQSLDGHVIILAMSSHDRITTPHTSFRRNLFPTSELPSLSTTHTRCGLKNSSKSTRDMKMKESFISREVIVIVYSDGE